MAYPEYPTAEEVLTMARRLPEADRARVARELLGDPCWMTYAEAGRRRERTGPVKYGPARAGAKSPRRRPLLVLRAALRILRPGHAATGETTP